MLRIAKTLLGRIAILIVVGTAFASVAVAAEHSVGLDSDVSAFSAVTTTISDQGKAEGASRISAAQRQGGGGTVGTVGTVGVRPGWGCGDKNHTHSGPPGRPGATPPPGCRR
jgi:hypothetical protein